MNTDPPAARRAATLPEQSRRGPAAGTLFAASLAYAAPVWNGPPRPSANGTIPVAGFNAAAVGFPAAIRTAQTPAALAGRFARFELADAGAVYVRGFAYGPGASVGSGQVIFDRLRDDSVRTIRYRLSFRLDAGGVWRLTGARFASRCQPGRGHQGYSPALCV